MIGQGALPSGTTRKSLWYVAVRYVTELCDRVVSIFVEAV